MFLLLLESVHDSIPTFLHTWLIFSKKFQINKIIQKGGFFIAQCLFILRYYVKRESIRRFFFFFFKKKKKKTPVFAGSTNLLLLIWRLKASSSIKIQFISTLMLLFSSRDWNAIFFAKRILSESRYSVSFLVPSNLKRIASK
jgi:hypothetical protein